MKLLPAWAGLGAALLYWSACMQSQSEAPTTRLDYIGYLNTCQCKGKMDAVLPCTHEQENVSDKLE